MIIVKLKGGLGNQMFQYAAARRLAAHNNTKLFIDKQWFEENKYNVTAPRVYELDCFGFPQKFKIPSQYALISDRSKSLKTKVYNFTKGKLKPRIQRYLENEVTFLPEVLKLPDNTLLEGFWLSEKYFKDIRQTILKEFEFKYPPAGQNRKLLAEIRKNDEAVSIHVRRGDYVSDKSTNDKHGIVGLDYYKSAVKQLRSTLKKPHFFVFSDEPEWCKQNLKLGSDTTFVAHNSAGSEDLRLMKNCRHHIIANSTFSWWGAWLNPNDVKIVIAPKYWFTDSTMDFKDVVPKEWQKL